MSLSDIVAQNLLAARKQRKLTQAGLAKKAGVSVSYVSMLERAQRSPPLEMVEVMAKALGMPPVDLLRGRPGKGGRSGKR